MADDCKMSAVTLRVKHAGGQGVVKGLLQTDSLEKLISHSLEALGIDDTPGAAIRLLAGFPPKVNHSPAPGPARVIMLSLRLWTFLTKTNLYPRLASSPETPSSSRSPPASPGLRRPGRGLRGTTRDRRLRLSLNLSLDPPQVCRGKSSQRITAASSLPSTTACPAVWSPVSTVPS